jgi:hypothetical protein
MEFIKEIPRWEGVTVEPPEQKKIDGYIPGDRPPAYWENWFRKANYEAHEETRDNIDLLNLNKVDKVEGKDLSTNDFTTLEKQKLAGIQEGATNYQHPATHSLDMITETTLRKIFSYAERTKLSGIDEEANNYTHPSSHSLDMITETTAKKIMTSAERSKLEGIQSGAQVNAVTSVAGKTGAVSVTKSDVGLGSVLNYGVATTAEAQAGTSNTTYMTPLRVKEALKTLAENNLYVTGSFIGDSTNDRTINLGFTPSLVVISGRNGYTSLFFQGASPMSELSVVTNGFNVLGGFSYYYNYSGKTTTYWAFK